MFPEMCTLLDLGMKKSNLLLGNLDFEKNFSCEQGQPGCSLREDPGRVHTVSLGFSLPLSVHLALFLFG